MMMTTTKAPTTPAVTFFEFEPPSPPLDLPVLPEGLGVALRDSTRETFMPSWRSKLAFEATKPFLMSSLGKIIGLPSLLARTEKRSSVWLFEDVSGYPAGMRMPSAATVTGLLLSLVTIKGEIRHKNICTQDNCSV